MAPSTATIVSVSATTVCVDVTVSGDGNDYRIRRTLVNGDEHHYQASADMMARLTQLRIHHNDVEGARRYYFNGERGEERLILITLHAENVDASPFLTRHYTGARGNERLIRDYAHGNDMTWFYEGPRGDEHIVRSVDGDGDICLYDHGRMIKKVFYATGTMAILGENERVIRWQFTNGVTHFLEGPCGEERLVRRQTTDGVTEFYAGVQGNERLVRMECAMTTPVPCEARSPHRERLLCATIAKKHADACKRVRSMR